MFHITDVVQLQEQEHVERIVRRHPVTLVPSLFLSAVLIIIPFFFLFHLLKAGVFGVLCFVIFVAVGVFIAMRVMHIWDADVVILTNRRVVDVDQHGLWARVVSEVSWQDIQEVRWERRGMIDVLCRMGMLRFYANVPPSELSVPHVSHPETVLSLIQTLRQKHSSVSHLKAVAVPEEGLSQRERIQLLMMQATEQTLTDVERILQAKANAQSST